MTLEQTTKRVIALADEAVMYPLPEGVRTKLEGAGTKKARMGYFDGREVTTKPLRISMYNIQNRWHTVCVSTGTGNACEHPVFGLLHRDDATTLFDQLVDVEAVAVLTDRY